MFGALTKRQVFSTEVFGEPKSNWNWWAERRSYYNLLLFLTGGISWLLVLFAGGAAVKPGVDFEEPLVMISGPPIYALMANLCYTAGPILDTFRRKPSLRLYKVGLIFSVTLTLLPGIWALYCWIESVVTGQKLD